MRKKEQLTSHIMMVRPAYFGFNEETAENNRFQKADSNLSADEIADLAKNEFDEFVKKLRKAGIAVLVMNDTSDPITPDAVFPNNWISMHSDGTVITYPMFANIRRKERNKQFIEALGKRYKILEYIDITPFEKDNIFLEGTGSMIFDHPNAIVYACLSVRTDEKLLNRLASRIGYEPVVFSSVDEQDIAIYHTNVMMAVGEHFVVICLETIKDTTERAKVTKTILDSGKEIIEISMSQMGKFAGNMIQLKNDENERFLIMSDQAHQSLNKKQIYQIEKYATILSAPLYTIEQFGGGSARCMIAEIFLPKL